MTQRLQTGGAKEAELRDLPVVYHENGNVKFPVTYTQLLRECERLQARVSELTGHLDWLGWDSNGVKTAKAEIVLTGDAGEGYENGQ